MSTILIVDDEESIRINFEAFLREDGHTALVAEDFHSAVDIIGSTDLDLVLADILLKGHTGIDILRAVKQKQTGCPVVMITGEPNLQTSAEAVRLGAFDYLTKPIRRATLLKVVGLAMRQKRLEDEKERYRSHLEAIFRSLISAIVSVDHDLRVIEANEACSRVLGSAPGEIVGQKFTRLDLPCHRECLGVLQEALQKNHTVREYRAECRHSAGRPGQVLVMNSSPLLDSQKRSMGAVLVIRDITRLSDLERELQERHRFHNIIGKSPAMQEIFRLVEDLAEVDSTVLITGESGTGKELIGKALHYSGSRSEQPMVSVNCSALAEDLLESELFGHVRGAFTGAIADKIGRFQLAHQGTLFLDEIGDVSPRLQLRLLRVLQEREFERVGDSRPIKVDVRVIAATNRNLRRRIASDGFREDLYYRLKVVEIKLPPLRERTEDIPLLAEHFRQRLNRRFKKTIDGLSERVLDLFMRYPWPGNIRELEHALEHAAIVCRESLIRMAHLPVDIANHQTTAPEVLDENPDDERELFLRVLNETDWNKAKAARRLGISRPTLYSKIKSHRLREPTE